MDVAEWLRGLGLERYATAFRENDVDEEVLRRLTADDLRELGVASIGTAAACSTQLVRSQMANRPPLSSRPRARPNGAN
jgi:hypothetical protein